MQTLHIRFTIACHALYNVSEFIGDKRVKDL